ncbi:MAG: NAD-dependent epimerase/dehydratase family protein [Caldilineaceae bacterium]|nr:NAD-dependent epimerase/dehydratase family protein [Caldilineaceae bacterium]
MRVCVTGAGGYLGRVLVEHFSRLPEVESITAVDLAPPAGALPVIARFVEMDVRSPGIADVIAGHQAVVHTAFVVQWPANMSARERQEINLTGTRNVAQAAVANRVRRFIYASSVAAYDPELARGQSVLDENFPLGRGLSPFYYANDKAATERDLATLLANPDIILTSLRPHFIVGPGRIETVAALRASNIVFRGHDPRLQFVHEDDVAAAFVQALLTEMPGAFNVVPDDAMRLSQLLHSLGQRRPRQAPLWAARLYLWITWRYRASPTHPSWLEGILTDATASNLRLRATGWAPRFSCEQALAASAPP